MAREIALPLELEEEQPERPRRPRRLLQTARRHPLGVFGLLFVGLLIFCGIFADLLVPYDPIATLRETRTFGTLVEPVDENDDRLSVADSRVEIGTNFNIENERITVLTVLPSSEGTTVLVQRGSSPTAHSAGSVLQLETAIPLESPSFKHPFGTDHNAKDVLSRVIFGARISLLIGLVAISTGVTAGAILGVISGYFGKIIDTIIQRGVDILLAFPAVVLLLAIITVIGDEDSAVRKFLSNSTPLPDRDFIGIPNFIDVFIVALAIGLAVAVFTTRVVRGAVLSIKENVYVDAARAMGASDARIMMRHIFPNVIALVVILGSVLLPVAILAEATISFLGIGVPIPTPSWGADLSDEKSRSLMLEGYWWPVFFPGFALSLVVLGFNMLGDAFRDLSDPRLRGSGLGGGSGGGGGGGGGGGAI
jgi:peptide/nickel transport system permease protein